MDKTYKTHKTLSMTIQDAKILELLCQASGKSQSDILKYGIYKLLDELKRKGTLPKELEDQLVNT